MDAIQQFKSEVQANIQRLGQDPALAADTLAWMIKAGTVGAYTYNFQWLGRPIIQYCLLYTSRCV